MEKTRLRVAEPRDHAAIAAVVAEAFGRPDEAGLVEALRRDGDARLEVVAESDGALVGHILFSPLRIGDVEGTALAPLAVHSAHRRRGIGADLVGAGIARLRDAGCPAIVVLGDPAYYRRFGFDAAETRALQAPFSGPAFMALRLAGPPLTGCVRYARAFALDTPAQETQA